MKFRSKIIWLFLIVAIVAIVFAVLVGQFVGQRIINKLVVGQIEINANLEKIIVNDYLSSLSGRMIDFSSDGEIRECVLRISKGEGEVAGCPGGRQGLNQHLVVNKLPLIDNLERLFVLDLNGEIISSTLVAEIGSNKENEKYFAKGLLASSIVGPKFDKKNALGALYVSAPIWSQTESGEVIGVVVGEFNLSAIISVFEDQEIVGKTAEILLAFRNENGNAQFFTPRKFESDIEAEDIILKTELDVPITQALLKNETILMDSVDYRGESVIAATRYIEIADWGLVSKIDQAEAFLPLRELSIAIGVYLIILIFIISLAVVVSRLLLRSLESLSEGAGRVRRGDLNYRIKVNTKDELSDLADDFNQMVESIQESRKDIDKKVAAQTEKIVSTQEDLYKQQKAVLNILEDVEDERDKAESFANDLNKFKLAVEYSSDHVVITDKDGIIIYANRAVENVTGYSEKEIIGQKAGTKENWGGQMKKDFYKKMWHTVLEKKETFSGEVNNIRKNGEKYIAFASIIPIMNSAQEVVFIVGIERDVTKEREIDRAKTEFVSLASHQLRTPLSTISWYVQMVLNGDAGEISTEQRDYLNEVYGGSRRMIELVNALLNVSRIELGTFAVEPEKVDITKISDEVVKEMKPQIKNKKINLDVYYDPKIDILQLDPSLIRIVFQNLISNAVKYTPEKGRVDLSIKKKEKEILVSVIDSGYGIPKKDHKKIFTKLFRADNVKEKDSTGTGLGLYITKSIVEQSGGKIWFESAKDKGTRFYFTIPITGMKKKEGSRALSPVE